MLRIRRAIRVGKPLNRSSNRSAKRWAKPSPNKLSAKPFTRWDRLWLRSPLRVSAAALLMLQGTMDFSGAQTLMSTFKNIGWHTFRHSFGTLLKANGVDVKTVQELLRHANSKITLDVYTQAVNSHKRAAQSKVVRMIVPGVGTKRDQARTGTEA